MTPEQTSVLLEIVKDIQETTNSTNKENEEFDEELKKKYDNLYIEIGKLIAVENLLVEEVKNLIAEVKKGGKNLTKEVQHVAEVVDVSPVHIVKRDLTIKDLFRKLKIWDKHQDNLT